MAVDALCALDLDLRKLAQHMQGTEVVRNSDRSSYRVMFRTGAISAIGLGSIIIQSNAISNVQQYGCFLK